MLNNQDSSSDDHDYVVDGITSVVKNGDGYAMLPSFLTPVPQCHLNMWCDRCG